MYACKVDYLVKTLYIIKSEEKYTQLSNIIRSGMLLFLVMFEENIRFKSTQSSPFTWDSSNIIFSWILTCVCK